MARPSMRAERRAQITSAFARVLARKGYAGATIAAVAAEAGCAPGLVHHHFRDKEDLLASLLDELIARFRRRTRAREPGADPLLAWAAAALAEGDDADVVAARCWVGVLAEAVRQPGALRHRAPARRHGDRRHHPPRPRRPRRSGGGARALAFVVGALVVGAFAPRKTAGFALPGMRRLLEARAAR